MIGIAVECTAEKRPSKVGKPNQSTIVEEKRHGEEAQHVGTYIFEAAGEWWDASMRYDMVWEAMRWL